MRCCTHAFLVCFQRTMWSSSNCSGGGAWSGSWKSGRTLTSTAHFDFCIYCQPNWILTSSVNWMFLPITNMDKVQNFVPRHIFINVTPFHEKPPSLAGKKKSFKLWKTAGFNAETTCMQSQLPSTDLRSKKLWLQNLSTLQFAVHLQLFCCCS